MLLKRSVLVFNVKHSEGRRKALEFLGLHLLVLVE